jgi:hypothetical protein
MAAMFFIICGLIANQEHKNTSFKVHLVDYKVQLFMHREGMSQASPYLVFQFQPSLSLCFKRMSRGMGLPMNLTISEIIKHDLNIV